MTDRCISWIACCKIPVALSIFGRLFFVQILNLHSPSLWLTICRFGFKIYLHSIPCLILILYIVTFVQCCGAGAKNRGAEIKLPARAEVTNFGSGYFLFIKDLKKFYG